MVSKTNWSLTLSVGTNTKILCIMNILFLKFLEGFRKTEKDAKKHEDIEGPGKMP